MKLFPILLAAAVCIPGAEFLHADETKKLPRYEFEFKIAKQRKSRDKKGGSANSSTSELWNYKVEVENRSLQDVGKLEVKYVCYGSTHELAPTGRPNASPGRRPGNSLGICCSPKGAALDTGLRRT